MDLESGDEFAMRHVGSDHSMGVNVTAGKRVPMRLRDRNGAVVSELQHTFEAGTRPIVDLSPR